jgi:hypothetical protein
MTMADETYRPNNAASRYKFVVAVSKLPRAASILVELAVDAIRLLSAHGDASLMRVVGTELRACLYPLRAERVYTVAKDAPLVKAPRGAGKAVNIPIMGHRDPRGPDNNVHVWVDDEDRLHIRVMKTDRCYRFERVAEEQGYVEVVAR